MHDRTVTQQPVRVRHRTTLAEIQQFYLRDGAGSATLACTHLEEV